MSRAEPDAREVDRLDAVVTPAEATDPGAFLARCVAGSVWLVSIRTAEVRGRLEARTPLGTLDERLGTRVRVRLERPVPVEPGLAVRLVSVEDEGIAAAGVVRVWEDPPI